MNRTMIDRYESGSDALAAGVEGMAEPQFDARPVKGTWSVRELVAHMMDSDQIGSYRMKSVIAHDRPTLPAYDQDAFVERLQYGRLDVRTSLQAFRANREATADMLRGLPDEAFAREGVHEETGPTTLAALVELYVWHVEHHLRYLNAKRVALGLPAVTDRVQGPRGSRRSDTSSEER